MLLLADVIIYVADEELESLVEDFCCLTGATRVDAVTPCLTTHIICLKETPSLRGMIGSVHAKVTSGATSAKAALTTERSHLDLVTPHWLKSCLLKQRQAKEGLFRPIVVKTTTETVMAGVNKSASAKSGLNYRVKQNLFQGQTFAVMSDTFISAGETCDFVEGIKRRIFEYGGKVVGEGYKSNYVVMEDGSYPEIWNTNDQLMQDDKSRNIVHYRWIDDCIQNQAVFNHAEHLNLIPLPHKTPNNNFVSILQPEQQKKLGITDSDIQNGAIAFTLVNDHVFEELAELYGIQNKFKE